MNRTIFPLLLVLLLCVSCTRRISEDTNGKLQIFVSIPPQKYFVEKICGELATVKVLIPSGASPHTYEPKPSQMAELAAAQIYFTIAVEMENVWLPRIRELNPGLAIISTDSGIVKRGMDTQLSCGHDSEDVSVDHHDHGGEDPHIWLAPSLVKQQARCIAGALSRIDTVHRAVFMKRLSDFENEIDSIGVMIRKKFSGCAGNRTFMVFHPSWGYFADEFSLRQIAIEMEGKEPGIREVGEIIAIAKKLGISTILVQPQFSRRIAENISKHLGGQVKEADPMAEDWAANLVRVSGVICE